MITLRQDLRSALRLARRKPEAVAVIVLAVALGIGACATTFCLVWALVLRPLPFTAPESIYAVLSVPTPRDASIFTQLSYADYEDVRAESETLTDVASFLDNFGLTLYGSGPGKPGQPGNPEPERVNAVLASERLLPLLGVEPILGRHIREEEARRNADPVVLLGYGLWQRRFGGDPGIVGKTIQANSMPYQVIGVMPPGFAFPDGDEAWISMGFQIPGATRARILRRWAVIGRLRPGVPPERAREEMAALGRRLAALHPEDAGWNLEILPFRRAMIDEGLRRSGLAVLAAVLSVLLIACANITDLLLAHAAERRREIAVRAALGATPGRIVRQLLTESLLFALAGGALGLPLGAAGVRFLRGILPPLPYGFDLTADAVPLAAALAAALGAGLLFGMAPALQASRPDLTEAFRHGGLTPRRKGRLHAGLVVSEIALSAVLLVSASLALRSLTALRSEPAGVVPQSLFTVWVQLSGEKNRGDVPRAQTARAIVERLAAEPGIDTAAAGNFVPLAASNATHLRITEVEGKPPGADRASRTALCFAVTSGFFRTAGTPILEGRELTAEEGSTQSAAAVVSRSLARSLWPDGPAVGRRFRLDDPQIPGWVTVVGVAGDLKTESLREGSRPQVFLSEAYNIYRPATLLVRTRLPREKALAAVRRVVRTVDPQLALFRDATMNEVLAEHLRTERLSSGGLVLFGTAALFFAALGTYGIPARTMVRRRREIAVRLALGAPRGALLRGLIGRGMALALAGLTLGLLAGLAVSRALAGNLFGVTPTDPVSYAWVAILLLDVAFIACWLPARKALEIEPAEVLRED